MINSIEVAESVQSKSLTAVKVVLESNLVSPTDQWVDGGHFLQTKRALKMNDVIKNVSVKLYHALLIGNSYTYSSSKRFSSAFNSTWK